MYKTDDTLQLPTKKATIWRFMPLSGLLSLLQRKQLFFAKARQMSDPYDTDIPRHLERKYWLWAGFRPQDLSDPGTFSDRVVQVIRGSTCINCWHINPVESAAMWELYSSHHGIAIRSSVERLIQAVGNCPDWVRIGAVQYVDFAKPRKRDAEHCLQAEFVKRKSFAHERELRAVTVKPGVYRKKIPGVYVDVDVAALIDSIYLSPTVDVWVRDVVAQEIRMYGHPDVRLVHSTLYSRELK